MSRANGRQRCGSRAHETLGMREGLGARAPIPPARFLEPREPQREGLGSRFQEAGWSGARASPAPPLMSPRNHLMSSSGCGGKARAVTSPRRPAPPFPRTPGRNGSTVARARATCRYAPPLRLELSLRDAHGICNGKKIPWEGELNLRFDP